MKLARILFTVQETAKKINEDKITAYAAQTCYYLLLSFMPFIIALINIIHYFPVTSSDLLDLLENIIPQEFHPMLINIFTEFILRCFAFFNCNWSFMVSRQRIYDYKKMS